ncbi:MAG: hypothetical protein ABI759_09465 [Candidatus Solibacter sp.]
MTSYRTLELMGKRLTLVTGLIAVSMAAWGQDPMPHDHQHPSSMPGMDHSAMGHSGMNAAGMFLMNESSGTAFQPAAWPMPMVMTSAGNWRLMWMGQAFLTATQQSGPRGGDKLYSSNWGMLGAVHKLGGGSLMMRSMLSLEPATVTDRRYPLLFQTGETAYGSPIVDGQHPHDFVMELSVQYAHPIGEKATWNLYYAPVGDPALGPVAFPHRASAMELPQASLSHHWQDSTHIANNVLTAGVTYGKVRLEASGFHGGEPDEGRWNIDWGAMDSWAARLSVSPGKNWMAQVSAGRLSDPEAHGGDILRTTASVTYVRPAAAKNWWATSFLWGQNYKLDERRRTNAVQVETVAPLSRRNFVTGRFEWSQRDELFEDNHTISDQLMLLAGKQAFHVTAYTAGYTRDAGSFRNLQAGVGANVTAYAIDSVLKAFYGNHPWGVNVFVRFRLKPGG